MTVYNKLINIRFSLISFILIKNQNLINFSNAFIQRSRPTIFVKIFSNDEAYLGFLVQDFIPMASRDWNSLPATVFPATYNLQLFKTRTHRYL